MKHLVTAVPLLFVASCHSIGGSHDEVRAVLERQQAAWNRGDIDAFLEDYWNSEELSFSSSSGMIHGWEATRERYLTRYPDRKAMGTLAFSGLEISRLGQDAALVLGAWHLTREDGDVGGVFSVVLKRFEDGWKIVHDHTSVLHGE